MPTISPAIDPTIWTLDDWADGEALVSPDPIIDEPVPGDPDTEWVRPLYADGLRVQVLLTDAVTHEVIDEIRTADVTDFDEDCDLLVPCSAKITASLWDSTLPGQVATSTTTDVDGNDVHRWTPKLHGVEIGINGVARWVGLFRQPLDHGPDVMLLPARSPSALFFEDTLGRVEQLDLYDGWGNFETVSVGSTPPGMHVPDGCSALVVWDAVRGRKALEVTGPFGSWVQCPKIGLPGQSGVRRSAEGSTFGRWPAAFANNEQTIRTYTQRTDSLAPSNPEATTEKAGTRPDSGVSWSDDPVSSGCLMSPSTITHLTWNELRCHPDGVRYDVVRLAQGILTGFLEDTDGAYYVEKIIKDAKSEALGGYPYGFNTRIESLVGSGEFQQVWNHNGTHGVSDVLSAAMARDGGAEAYINAQHVCVIRGRLGADRTDEIVLSNANTIEATWAIDPGAQADDFVGLTGRGNGTSLLASTVSQPRYPNRHRITKIARIPNGLTLNQGDAWTLRHARVSARQQATGTALVTWDLGAEIAKGDVVSAAFSAGRHGWWDPIRILNKRWIPADHACLLTWGATEDVG